MGILNRNPSKITLGSFVMIPQRVLLEVKVKLNCAIGFVYRLFCLASLAVLFDINFGTKQSVYSLHAVRKMNA